MMPFLMLLGLAVFIGGIILVVRVLTLPGDVRALRERLETVEQSMRSFEIALAATKIKMEEARGEPARTLRVATPRESEDIAVTAPKTSTFEEPDFETSEAISEIVRDAKAAKAISASVEHAASVPPPLPPQQVVSLPVQPYERAEDPLSRWLKSLGPKDKNMTWEMALGTYWLPRLGALALTTAIVFLLTLAFQKWGPPLRVATGYGVAAVLLGLGWRFDRKYPAYARVLFGAGFALTYFVTFATYFVKFAKIFDTPYLSLGGLAAIVIAWAGLAQRRKSPVIAGVAVVMGHFTIALATYSIDNPAVYSVAGIVFLSVGGAFFLARNGWYSVAAIGLVASYANHFFLMTKVKSAGTPFEFAVGMGILSTYFLVFAAAELASPESIRRERIPLWFRNGFVAVNTVSLFLLGTILMYGYDFAKDEREIFYYALAAVLLAFSIAYLRLRKADPLYNAYFVKAISAVTIGLATQFDAHTLTASLAVECAVLLLAARRTGLLVTRIVALGAGALALLQGGWTIAGAAAIPYGAETFWPRTAEASTVVLAFLAAALLYQRTDWSTRSPLRSRFSPETGLMLWKLDLLAAPPAGHESAIKPFDGLLMPIIFSLSGALLALGYAHQLSAPENLALVLMAGAALLTAAAMALRATPYALASFVLAAAGSFVASLQFRGFSLADLTRYETVAAVVPLNRAIPILVCLALIALASEKRYLAAFKGLALHQVREVPFVLYGVFSLLLGLLLDHSIASPARLVAALLIAAVALAAAAVPLNRQALAWCATALLVWAVVRWNVDWALHGTNRFLATAWIGIAVAVAAERYFARLGVKFVGSVSMCAAAALFVPYVYHEAPHEWVALWWTLGGAVFAAHGGLLRGKTAAALGVGMIAAASLYQSIYTQDHHPGAWPIIAGFAAPALCWIVIERAISRFAGRVGLDAQRAAVQGVAAGAATALLLLMLSRLPQLAEYYLTISWSVLAVAFFGLAIALREKLYRYCGLAVLGLAFLRVGLIDTRQLEAIPRVFALGGIGVVALLLAYGYSRVFAQTLTKSTPGTDE